jgi:hypothetical protein
VLKQTRRAPTSTLIVGEIARFSSLFSDTDTVQPGEKCKCLILSLCYEVAGMRPARFAPVHLSPTSTGDKIPWQTYAPILRLASNLLSEFEQQHQVVFIQSVPVSLSEPCNS